METMTGGEKLAVVGIGTTVVIGITVLAFVVSRCRRAYGRWDEARARGDRAEAEDIRQEAIRMGCDWPTKVGG